MTAHAPTPPSGYYDGLNEKLLNAVPDVRKILELGCANGRLGQRFKELHPHAQWYGVDVNDDAVQTASTVLDGAFRLDLDDDSLAGIGSGYDAIVVGDLLEHLKDPELLLRRLRDISTDEARLVCCVPNMAHITVLERVLMGDITYDPNGLLDKTHLRFFSPASIFKTFLDSGWMPHLTDFYTSPHPNARFLESLVGAGATIGMPKAAVQRNLLLYQLIVDCTKVPDVAPIDGPPITVIVAVNRDNQLQANLLHSPGLAEINPQVVLVRDATSAADAFERGLAQAQAPWVIYAHQDVDFPKTSGYALRRLFASIPPNETADTLIGFAGIALDEQSRAQRAGLVIDRLNRFDYPASDRGLCIDEFAVAMHRSNNHRLDRDLGWHLWGTDLCLAAAVHGRPMAKIVRIPLFHNSFGDSGLPPAELFDIATRLGAKYPTVPVIPTLHGDIKDPARL